MVRPSCKGLLLDAAEALVLEDGAVRLTIDGVAEKAGMSKGGVLYHFPTKEALLAAMLDRRMERGRCNREAALAATPPGPGQSIKADIATVLLCKDEQDRRFASAMLAAIANDPKMMTPVCTYHRDRFAAYAADPDYLDKCLLLLAADGLFLLEVLNISPFTAEDRDRLVQWLLAMVDERLGTT